MPSITTQQLATVADMVANGAEVTLLTIHPYSGALTVERDGNCDAIVDADGRTTYRAQRPDSPAADRAALVGRLADAGARPIRKRGFECAECGYSKFHYASEFADGADGDHRRVCADCGAIEQLTD